MRIVGFENRVDNTSVGSALKLGKKGHVGITMESTFVVSGDDGLPGGSGRHGNSDHNG